MKCSNLSITLRIYCRFHFAEPRKLSIWQLILFQVCRSLILHILTSPHSVSTQIYTELFSQQRAHQLLSAERLCLMVPGALQKCWSSRVGCFFFLLYYCIVFSTINYRKLKCSTDQPLFHNVVFLSKKLIKPFLYSKLSICYCTANTVWSIHY